MQDSGIRLAHGIADGILVKPINCPWGLHARLFRNDA
jgi:hypothetical protein